MKNTHSNSLTKQHLLKATLLSLVAIMFSAAHSSDLQQPSPLFEFTEAEKSELYTIYKNYYEKENEQFREGLSINPPVDATIPTVIGGIHLRANNYSKARAYYELAANMGHWFASIELTLLQSLGKGGPSNLAEKINYIQTWPLEANDLLVSEYHNFLNEIQSTYRFNTKPVLLYWYEKASKKNIGYTYGDYTEHRAFFNNKIAAHYDPLVYSDTIGGNVLYATIAHHYYRQGGIVDKSERLEALLSAPAPAPFSNKQFQKDCNDIFKNTVSNYQEFTDTQQAIYQSPKDAEDIIKAYRDQAIARHYPEGDSEEGIAGLYFDNLSLHHIVNFFLEFDSKTARYHNPLQQSGLQNKQVTVSTKTSKLPFRSTVGLYLAHANIEISCTDNGIRLTPKARSARKHISFNPHFISHWKGDFSVTSEGLSGTGEVFYEDVIKLTGSFINSQLQGRGEKTLLEENTTYQSDNFIEGNINGLVEIRKAGNIIYSGGYKHGAYHGVGKFAVLNSRYEGEFSEGLKHGVGRLEFIDRKLPREHLVQYRYPLNDKAEVISWYEGSFKNDMAHGKGKCGIFSENRTEELFDCEFYNNTLIRIGQTSLLPGNALYSTHLKWVEQH